MSSTTPPTPQDELEALEKKLADSSTAAEELPIVKAAIASLKKLIGDEEQAASRYAREYAGFEHDKKKRDEALKKQETGIDANLSQPDRARVALAIKQTDELIKKLGDAATASAADAKAKLEALAAAKAASKAAQDALTVLSGEPWKPANESLKKVADLTTAALTSAGGKNYPVAHFFATDARAELKLANLDKPEDFEKKLDKAVMDVVGANKEEQKAKAASDAATAKKAADEKALTEAQSKRQETIIRNINSGASVPAPAGGGGTNP